MSATFILGWLLWQAPKKQVDVLLLILKIKMHPKVTRYLCCKKSQKNIIQLIDHIDFVREI